ncbi:hypothetical protein MBLNU459_g7147t1 [Dothideomycetes sp. NU459]
MVWQVLQNAPDELADFWSNIAPSMPSSLPSFRSLLMAGSQVAMTSRGFISDAPTCPGDLPISCHNDSIVENLCCFNAPGGQMLQTQFWDTNPPTGPSDSWTIHGLWPDKCDGSYEANCDDSRAYPNITAILESFGATDLLDTMTTYWKDYKGNDESLWMHEWSKHGTCVSTLDPSCYPSYKSAEEAVDYFRSAVTVYQSRPTYEWLAEAGIVPSNSAKYTRDQIQTVLTAKHGREVTLGCKSGKLDEVWYHFDVKGSVQTGTFIAADPDGGKSTCPATGIRYPPKGSGRRPTATRGTSAAPTATGPQFSGRGHLNVQTKGSQKGCIISGGKWYVSGTCASFRATGAGGGFTLSSTKGKCAVKDGALICAASITDATVFEADGKALSFGGNSTFYADGVPRGWKQGTVYVAEEGHSTELSIIWQST